MPYTDQGSLQTWELSVAVQGRAKPEHKIFSCLLQVQCQMQIKISITIIFFVLLNHISLSCFLSY